MLIRDDKIIEVGKSVTPGEEIIDAKGLFLAPGFVDVHTHAVFGYYKIPFNNHVLSGPIFFTHSIFFPTHHLRAKFHQRRLIL